MGWFADLFTLGHAKALGMDIHFHPSGDSYRDPTSASKPETTSKSSSSMPL
jgi:hypothetical protein